VVERHFLFWLAVLVLVVLALWLLSEILLPFVAGLAIAYLLTPLTDRLERFGINRLAALPSSPSSCLHLFLQARSCLLSTACRQRHNYRRFWA
jgi:predicted PurR-regulated permease PerM